MIDRYKQASELFRGGRFEEAIEQLKIVCESEPERWEVYDKLADCYKVLGAFDEGERYFKQLTRKQETNTWAKIGIAKMRFLKGSPLSALGIIEETQTQFVNTQNAIGLAHVEFYKLYITSLTGHFEGLFEALEALVSQFRSLQDSLGLVKTLSFYANMREFHGECSQAKALYSEALTLASALGNDDRVAVIYVDRGLCYMHNKEYDRARSDFLEAQTIGEKLHSKLIHTLALFSLAELSRETQMYEAALTYISSAQNLLKTAPFAFSECQLLISEGRILLENQDPARAADVLEKALKLARTLGDRQLEIYASIFLAQSYFVRGNQLSARNLAKDAVHSLEELLEGVDNERVRAGIRREFKNVYELFVSVLDTMGDSKTADTYRVYT